MEPVRAEQEALPQALASFYTSDDTFRFYKSWVGDLYKRVQVLSVKSGNLDRSFHMNGCGGDVAPFGGRGLCFSFSPFSFPFGLILLSLPVWFLGQHKPQIRVHAQTSTGPLTRSNLPYRYGR